MTVEPHGRRPAVAFAPPPGVRGWSWCLPPAQEGSVAPEHRYEWLVRLEQSVPPCGLLLRPSSLHLLGRLRRGPDRQSRAPAVEPQFAARLRGRPAGRGSGAWRAPRRRGGSPLEPGIERLRVESARPRPVGVSITRCPAAPLTRSSGGAGQPGQQRNPRSDNENRPMVRRTPPGHLRDALVARRGRRLCPGASGGRLADGLARPLPPAAPE